MKAFSIYSLIVCFLIPIALSAQEDAQVSIRFQIFIWAGESPPTFLRDSNSNVSNIQQQGKARYDETTGGWDIPDHEPYEFSYEDGSGTIRNIVLHDMALSPFFDYSGPPVLEFFEESIAADGDVIRVPKGQVTIPIGARQMTLIFFPYPSGNFGILPVKTQLDVIGKDQQMFYNLTDGPLGIALGEPRFLLPKGDFKVVDINSPDGIYQPIMIVSQDVGGDWHRRLARKLVITEGKPVLYVLYNPSNQPENIRMITVSGFGDFSEDE